MNDNYIPEKPLVNERIEDVRIYDKERFVGHTTIIIKPNDRRTIK